MLELRMPHFTVSTNGVSILNKVEGNTMYTISRQTFGEVISERLGRALREEAGDDELVLRVMVGGKKISLDWQTREELTYKALERAVSEVADYLSLFADYEISISSTDPLVLSLFRERADDKLQFDGGVIAEFTNPGSIERLLKAFGTASLRELPEAARGKPAELHFVVAGARKEEVAHALTARAIQPMAIAYENQLLIQKAERILSVLTGKTEHKYRSNEAVRARAELARLVSKLEGILSEEDDLLKRATEHLEFMKRMETINFSDLLDKS